MQLNFLEHIDHFSGPITQRDEQMICRWTALEAGNRVHPSLSGNSTKTMNVV